MTTVRTLPVGQDALGGGLSHHSCEVSSTRLHDLGAVARRKGGLANKRLPSRILSPAA
jgi:hypothetical protein